jgi:hypothetical protein
LYQGLQFDLAEPILAVAAAGLFVSVASFTRRPASAGEPVVDASGWVDTVPADYTPVTGLQSIPCMLAVYSEYKPNIAGAERTDMQYNTLSWRHLLLNGYYPAILQTDLVTVDGLVYEIMSGAEHDSQHTMTRLAIRQYTL